VTNQFKTKPYGNVAVTKLAHSDAVDRVKALLKDEGFGVLCDIDVAKILLEKTGATFRPYRILGACNPHLAHQALDREPQLGLLLPCNVVIQEERGSTVVSAVDAGALLGVVGNADLSGVADDVNARLVRVLDAIAAE